MTNINKGQLISQESLVLELLQTLYERRGIGEGVAAGDEHSTIFRVDCACCRHLCQYCLGPGECLNLVGIVEIPSGFFHWS